MATLKATAPGRYELRGLRVEYRAAGKRFVETIPARYEVTARSG